MAINQLNVLTVLNLTKAGRYSDGNGLYLNIDQVGNKKWIFRFQLNGKRRNMGLGSFDKKHNSLAIARENALAAKSLVGRGIDPIEHRNTVTKQATENSLIAEQEAIREQQIKSMTFAICANNYIEIMTPQWSNKKHIQQWTNTLTSYAYPHIGTIPVNDIEVEDIRKCLEPIWNLKTETANRVRQRIESVIAYSIANKYRESSTNPAMWKGLLDQFFPKPEKVKQKRREEKGEEEHHNALAYAELPSFVAELKKRDGFAAQALRFTILTAARTGEVRFATWDEFNLDKKEWNIPKGRMKKRKAHRVALSDPAVELLKALPVKGDYVFYGQKEDEAMSDGAMLALLKRMGRSDITVHGFRSTFRDYIGEETGFPYRIAEFALAHGLSDATEKAYARGDMLAKRFKMMNAWADYVDSYVNTESNE